MSSDLLTISAVDLLEAYRTKRVSPVDVTRAVLQQIDILNPVLNAFCFVAPDALQMARWQRPIPEPNACKNLQEKTARNAPSAITSRLNVRDSLSPKCKCSAAIP